MRLLEAISIGQMGLVSSFIAEGDDVNEFSPSGNNPILEAASRNDTKIVEILLKHGADPEVKDMEGRTALYWSREYNNKNMEKMLLASMEGKL